jgi:hypothetical protein
MDPQNINPDTINTFVSEQDQPPEQANPVSSKTNGLAIAGFVLAFIASLIGLVLSIIALVQTKKTGDKGKGLAIAGIIVSSVVTALGVLLLVILLNTTQPVPAGHDDGREAILGTWKCASTPGSTNPNLGFKFNRDGTFLDYDINNATSNYVSGSYTIQKHTAPASELSLYSSFGPGGVGSGIYDVFAHIDEAVIDGVSGDVSKYNDVFEQRKNNYGQGVYLVTFDSAYGVKIGRVNSVSANIYYCEAGD